MPALDVIKDLESVIRGHEHAEQNKKPFLISPPETKKAASDGKVTYYGIQVCTVEKDGTVKYRSPIFKKDYFTPVGKCYNNADDRFKEKLSLNGFIDDNLLIDKILVMIWKDFEENYKSILGYKSSITVHAPIQTEHGKEEDKKLMERPIIRFKLRTKMDADKTTVILNEVVTDVDKTKYKYVTGKNGKKELVATPSYINNINSNNINDIINSSKLVMGIVRADSVNRSNMGLSYKYGIVSIGVKENSNKNDILTYMDDEEIEAKFGQLEEEDDMEKIIDGVNSSQLNSFMDGDI